MERTLDVITERCFARCGMIGNPSDGFEGKTVSFLIRNFEATVRLQSNEDGPEIELNPNPKVSDDVWCGTENGKHDRAFPGPAFY